MLANFFKKSNLFNQTLLWVLAMSLFAAAQVSAWQQGQVTLDWEVFARLAVWVMLLILTPFIAIKNNLTRPNGYALLWYLSFVALFPELLSNNRALLAQGLAVLALRRLISMQSLKTVRSKIFDATLLVGIAALIYPALSGLLLLVYVCIIIDASRDYRNWLLPIFGGLAVVMGLSLLQTLWPIDCALPWQWDQNWAWHGENIYVSTEQWPLGAFWAMASLLTVNMVVNLGVRPTAIQGGFKKCLVAILLGWVAFMLHDQPDPALLSVTFVPLAVLGASHIEFVKTVYYREGIMWLWVITTAVATVVSL